MSKIYPIPKNSTAHPLAKYMKWNCAEKVKTYHNSVNNTEYTARMGRAAAASATDHRDAFTVIGNRLTRDFLDCCQWLTTLYKYRSKRFKPPIIRGLTQLEWEMAWNDLKLRYGGEAFCISKPVAVLMNNEFLGDAVDLKKLLLSRYVYHFSINYRKRGIEEFGKYLQNSGRPCVYMHIAIDDQIVGSFVFMVRGGVGRLFTAHGELQYPAEGDIPLYTDLVPLTCENFMRLCRERRGGYGGTPLHRVVRDGWVQGGGYGLKSAPLPCENYAVQHDRRGVLSMANNGRHCDNSTQFIITLQPAEWLHTKYVAFGQLIDGEETLKKVEAVPTLYESPKSEIIIRKAGVLSLERKIRACQHTIEYLEKHILNVNELVERVMNDIFEAVNLELEYRLVVSKTKVETEDHTTKEDVEPVNDTKRLNADRLSFSGSVIRNIAGHMVQADFLASVLRSPEQDEPRKPFKSVVIADPAEDEGDAGKGIDDAAAKKARGQAVRRRRPTGYVRSQRADESSDSESASHVDSDDGVISLLRLAKLQQHDQLKKSVRIASASLPPHGSGRVGTLLRRPTGYFRATPAQLASATSLSRLLDAAAPHITQPDHGPRFKDYKPLTSMAPESFFLTSSANNRRSLMSEPLEERAQRVPQHVGAEQPSDSLDKILALRHGPRLVRRCSTDYVQSRFLIEKAMQRRLSIRTAEFAKKRPSLSVEQYKRKSIVPERELSQNSEPIANGTERQPVTSPNLYLKGDTPTYSWMDCVDNNGGQ